VVVGVAVLDVLVLLELVSDSRPAIPGSDESATGGGGPAREIAPLSVNVTNPVEEQTQNCVPGGSGWSLLVIGRGELYV
jgi:hypothetical protein